MKKSVSFDSPYYPYEKIQDSYSTMRGLEELPYKIIMYILDLADGAGYIPKDDNERARVRLVKYLYYDGAKPLAEALPSDEEKLSLLFDGNVPVLNDSEQKKKHPKGYRLFPLSYFNQSELEANTILKCYVGDIIPRSPYSASVGLTFEMAVNYMLDNVSRTSAYSKLVAMEQCLIEALHGVNIGGAGTVDYNRAVHEKAGSQSSHDDGSHLIRIVNMSVDYMC